MTNWLGPAKRKIFVSYHHARDRAYYLEFSRFFADAYESVEDNSVDRQIDSDNAEYVIRNIRENYITGSSCTVVLCGAETYQRKFVDWEIKATLDKQHGLVGVNLPTNLRNLNGRYTVPARLYDNIVSGYAAWTSWDQLTAIALKKAVEDANAKSRSMIDNSRPLKSRNG